MRGTMNGADGGDESELERPRLRIARRARRLDQLLRAAQQLRRAPRDVEPDGGGDDHALGALQQPDPEMVLQLLDRGAERRLADPTFLGRRAEMAALDHGDQKTQLAKGGKRRHGHENNRKNR